MPIKSTLTRVAEKVTGRKCTRCTHNCAGRCCHPDGRMFLRCWQSITRPGFEKRPPRYLKPNAGAKVEEIKPAPLTPEQAYQLAKIKAVLQQAEDDARESGLLED